MERNLQTELTILEVRERQFHCFPFSIPALRSLLHQAEIVENMTKPKTVEATDDLPTELQQSKTNHKYYRSRDENRRQRQRRGGF